MAFTVTARHAGQANSAQTITTGSTTPTALSLLLLFSASENDGHFTNQAWQAPVGGSLTYTSIATSGFFAFSGAGGYQINASSWRAPVVIPSAHTVVCDAYTATQAGYYNALAVDITGHDAVTPVTQSKTNGASTTTVSVGSPATIELDSTPAVGSLVVVYLAASNDAAGAFTAPTIGGQSITQHHNQSATFCHGGVWSRVITGTESNKTITCAGAGSSIGNWAGIAVEIKAAGGSSPVDLARITAASTTGALVRSKASSLGRVTGAGVAGALARSKSAGLARVTGVGAVGALARAKHATLSQVTGTSTIGALARSKATGMARVTEAAALGALARAKHATLSQVSELGTTGALLLSAPVLLGRVTEGSVVVVDLTRTKVHVLGQVAEAGAVGPLGVGTAVLLGRVTEAAAVGAVTRAKSTELGHVTETVEIGPLLQGTTILLGRVTEAVSVGPMSRSKALSLAQVSEATVVGALALARLLALGRVTEASATGALARTKRQALAQVVSIGLVRAVYTFREDQEPEPMVLTLIALPSVNELSSVVETLTLSAVLDTWTLEG